MGTDESTDLRYVMACTYCKYSSYPMGDGPLCTNKDSPFNVSDSNSGTFLMVDQALLGCDKIRLFHWETVLPEFFRQMPSDSQLRQLPLEENVRGYSPDMNLDNNQTTQDLLRKRGLLEE